MPSDGTRSRPGLLVSVRSACEAREAVLGGASVVDVKDPSRGPLGRADAEAWRAVREAVPPGLPVSVALGELGEWIGRPPPDPGQFRGIAYRKLGLAGMSRLDWASAWEAIRRDWGAGPRWVAVAYDDASAAGAPDPEDVLRVAIASPDCAGVLLDTWDKSRPARLGPDRAGWIARIRSSGRFVALAGGLDARAIARLAPMSPDLFAVRGAACVGGDRGGVVSRERVRMLVDAIEATADVPEVSRAGGAPIPRAWR